MRILGCFKAVPALDLLREEDWVADDSLRVDTEYVKLEWNCFDEGALEMMRKLSDLSEGLNVVFELDALTVGGKKRTAFLRYCMPWDFPMPCGWSRKRGRILRRNFWQN